MRVRGLSLIATLGLIAVLSERSGYSIRGDVESMNWDIALMLSPWGLIQNLILVPDHYLRPYYFELAQRGDLFQDPVLFVLIIFLGLTALTALTLIRRHPEPRE